MIKSYNQFLLEKYYMDGDKVFFNASISFVNTLTPLRAESKVARFLLQLKDGVDKDVLIENPSDFLSIVLDDGENYGYISFLKPKYDNGETPYTNIKRISQKATKALKEFYKESYINNELTNNDFQKFFALINAKKSTSKVLEFHGQDILRAYNYTKELKVEGFSTSCANFHQREMGGNFSEPKLEWYDVYVKNPDTFGVAVVMEDSKIVGRMSFLTGPNLMSLGKYKSGEVNTLMNNFYGVGGRGSANETKIINYLKSKYNAKRSEEGFLINIETRFAQFPPWDEVYVNFEKNLITNCGYGYRNQLIRELNLTEGWDSAYKANCPKKYINKRLKEELNAVQA